MDRGKADTLGALATRPNGNASSSGRGNLARPLFSTRQASQHDPSKPDSKENIISDTDASVGTSAHPRHPLYSSPRYVRHSGSLSTSTHQRPESPRETRIPRPKSTASVTPSPVQQESRGLSRKQLVDMRQPMSFKSAFELAKKQEADDQLDDDTFDIKQAFNIASAEMNGRIHGSPSPAPRNSYARRESHGAASQRPSTSRSTNDDLGSHLRKFDRSHQLNVGDGSRNNLFGRTRRGPNASETGDIPAMKNVNGGVGGLLTRHRTSQAEMSSRKSDSAVGSVGQDHVREATPVPAIEYKDVSDHQASPVDRSAHPSLEKSYNWQLDADFTAGDLQVSDSPRIRAGRSNGTSLRAPSSATSSPVSGTPNFRRSNNRLDQIRQKEIEAANAILSEDDPPLSKRTNSRLDELRMREMEALSKRSVAISRLDEIRIKNSEARSDQPDTGREPSGRSLRGGSLQIENEHMKTSEVKAESGAGGEEFHDPPIIIPRNTSNHRLSDVSKEERDNPNPRENTAESQLPRNDSHDLLRRLARATSNSPPAEKTTERQAAINDGLQTRDSGKREESRPRSRRAERISKNLEVKSSRERPTVGFVGLKREAFSESSREKRPSRSGSEADPTDRIEAEMKLFAPLDNMSEKSSLRAPSPILTELNDEETPRATKVDPLTQPTPRVTGAYVETPATVRVKQESGSLDDKQRPGGHSKASDAALSESRNRSSSEPWNRDSVEEEDDAEVSAKPRSSSAPTSSRRIRSASRRRRPLRNLTNTANPPSVKDDIRAILRMNQIDDSTLDDFDSILADQNIDDEELERMMNDTMHKIDDDLELPGLSERDRELRVYDRMSKSLKTGLLGIRSAKKGIERLEDKVTHTDHKAGRTNTAAPDPPDPKPETRASTRPDGPAPVFISVPALYRKSPRFRLTKMGLLTIVVFVWYIVESIFCSLYTTQYLCTPTVPCEWSPNEPYFPYAMPFMLDEWTTGGKGRELTWWIGEQVGDALAEALDWVTDTDFTQFDPRYMNVWQRKRHLRRLRKHGLSPKWVKPADYQLKFPAWNAARLAREAAEEFGYGYEEEDEMMSADERVR
ncbi:hypothetical protein GGS23DRAFT_544460 [Durotheca rogersii]|uniref:uncharacterized protein n=1 Tax=Durotheca rogersii TaxID=419775 RepID=UPI00221FF7D7|nr:uncharacterized protein GGS23DRAFT_544460 [Durotheca rogersii]KAI5868190.1 hypothetical protein GGS23DRAFT_544460 [Durotheca rogersii]